MLYLFCFNMIKNILLIVNWYNTSASHCMLIKEIGFLHVCVGGGCTCSTTISVFSLSMLSIYMSMLLPVHYSNFFVNVLYHTLT